jgi:hypothetical protein
MCILQQGKLGLYINTRQKENPTPSPLTNTKPSQNNVLPPPPIKPHHGPWRQFDTSSTHFPRSNFKSKTIIPLSVEIHKIVQYKYVPILFIALILILDFLNSYTLLRCIDVKSA